MDGTFGKSCADDMTSMSFDAMEDFAFKQYWGRAIDTKGDSENPLEQGLSSESDAPLEKTLPH